MYEPGDLAVFGLLVVSAQEVGNRPDEGGEGLMVHLAHSNYSFSRQLGKPKRKKRTATKGGR